jgi:hypothetical protein
MMMIEIVGGTFMSTCTTTVCALFTVRKDMSVTLRGVLGADGKRPILVAGMGRRRHIYNQGTLVIENLELTRGYIDDVRSCVSFCVTVAGLPFLRVGGGCSFFSEWREEVSLIHPAVSVLLEGKCTAMIYDHSFPL